jgi:hypothetical protein
MKKYQELENKIVELQQEVDRLKKEEKQNKLPEGFDRDICIKFLEEFSCSDLFYSFVWRDTPQGRDYWDKIHDNIYFKSYFYKVPQDAIIYIQDLIIKSYQQEFESK